MSNNIDINDLIRLGAFEVTDEEKIQFEKELLDFLEYAKIINESKCDDIVPASHAVEKDA